MRLETIPQGDGIKQRDIPCAIEECGRPSRAKNMCTMHYNRFRRSKKPCSVDGCEKPYFGRTYCSMHYERAMKYGDVGQADRTIGIFLKGDYSEKERKRFHKYGLMPEDFQKLLASQNFQCALCPAKYKDDQWHLDHDHRCCPERRACEKCIRGILCHKCNLGLGFVEKNIEDIDKVLSYVRSKEVNFICD